MHVRISVIIGKVLESSSSMLDLKQLSNKELIVLYHRLYQSTDTIFDNYWDGEDDQYPLAKQLDETLIQDMWHPVVDEIKERDYTRYTKDYKSFR